MCTVNVNSISNKVAYIFNLIKEENLNICAITESWLTSSCDSSYVAIDGYSLYRGDVEGTVRKHGSAIYVRKSLKHHEIKLSLPNVAAVFLEEFDLYVLSVYRPPSLSNGENMQLLTLLREFVFGREVLILGDFNLPTLDWSLPSVLDSYIRPLDREFYDCFTQGGLTQWVDFPTFFPSGNILDLILTTDSDRVGDVYGTSPLPGCHHCPVVCSLVYMFNTDDVPDRLADSRSWSRANFSNISEDIASINWEHDFDGLNVEQCYSYFVDVLNDSVSRNVPLRRPPARGRWLVQPPRAMTTQRRLLWQVYKTMRQTHGRNSVQASAAYSSFNRANNEYRNYSKYKQSNYELKLANLIPEAPKLFHAYLRERKKGCPSVGPLRKADSTLIHDGAGMSEQFADAFSSVYVASTPANPHPFQTYHGSLGELQVTYDAVRGVLGSISPSSSSGIDNVHPSILVGCADVIALPLTLIIRKSFDDGVLPSLWKISRVAPIFKSGSKFDPLNYRPVSITSAPCKVAERLIANHILDYLDQEDILCRRQFGFRKGRSTEDQLLLSYGKIAKDLDLGYKVDAIYLDFSKAFDVISHSILLEKLEAIGLPPLILGWIRSFLCGRSMHVSVGSSSSSQREVLSGVPQGSVLGPLLFILYVNSIGVDLGCEWYAFADDLKLFSSHRRMDANLTDQALQRDLDTLLTICTSWNLFLNPLKCVVIKFGARSHDYVDGYRSGYMLGSNPLKMVLSHRDLGIKVDSSLKFHHHISTIVNKASGLINQLLRSTVCRSPNFMVILFVSHVRPILEYGSTVWHLGYRGDLSKLESVQRRWTREVSGMTGVTYQDRLRQLRLFSIKGRLLRADLIKIWKIFHDQYDTGLDVLFERTFHRATRGHRYKISTPRCHTETFRRFFSVRLTEVWNSIPADIVEAESLFSFKARLDRYFHDKFLEV